MKAIGQATGSVYKVLGFDTNRNKWKCEVLEPQVDYLPVGQINYLSGDNITFQYEVGDLVKITGKPAETTSDSLNHLIGTEGIVYETTTYNMNFLFDVNGWWYYAKDLVPSKGESQGSINTPLSVAKKQPRKINV